MGASGGSLRKQTPLAVTPATFEALERERAVFLSLSREPPGLGFALRAQEGIPHESAGEGGGAPCWVEGQGAQTHPAGSRPLQETPCGEAKDAPSFGGIVAHPGTPPLLGWHPRPPQRESTSREVGPCKPGAVSAPGPASHQRSGPYCVVVLRWDPAGWPRCWGPREPEDRVT